MTRLRVFLRHPWRIGLKPGLEVEIDESLVEKYPSIPGPWSCHEIESPSRKWYLHSDHSQSWTGE